MRKIKKKSICKKTEETKEIRSNCISYTRQILHKLETPVVHLELGQAIHLECELEELNEFMENLEHYD